MEIRIEVPDYYMGREIKVTAGVPLNVLEARRLKQYASKLCSENFELIRKNSSKNKTLSFYSISGQAFSAAVDVLKSCKRDLEPHIPIRKTEDFMQSMDDVAFIVDTHNHIANVLMHQAENYLIGQAEIKKNRR